MPCPSCDPSDGQVLGFTTHDQALSIEGTLCTPQQGFEATKSVSEAGLNITTLSGSASTPEAVIAYIGGFTGGTLQNVIIPRSDFIIADTGF